MNKTIYEKMTDKIQLSGSLLIPLLFKMIADQNMVNEINNNINSEELKNKDEN